MQKYYDVIIIGTGAGRGTLAYALASTGKRILLLERRDYIHGEKQNRDAAYVYGSGRYRTEQRWLNSEDKNFQPTFDRIGGSTKYGVALLRMRSQDIDEMHHYKGISPVCCAEDAKSLGHIHLMGKHKWEMMQPDFTQWVPSKRLKVPANHSVDWWMQSEDLPNVENRIEIAKNRKIKVYYRSNNQKAHHRLWYQFKKILRKAGFAIILGVPMPLKVMNHQGGTCRFGSNSKVNVFDLNCCTPSG